jgi:predicted dinucleotide-binding enzyme
MNCSVMVAPEEVPGEHDLFYCGDDADAKREVADLIVGSLGWPRKSLVDLGDLTAARGMEMILPIWLRLWGAFGTPAINFHVAVGEGKR